jgi:hypothetical protein
MGMLTGAYPPIIFNKAEGKNEIKLFIQWNNKPVKNPYFIRTKLMSKPPISCGNTKTGINNIIFVVKS